MPEQPGAGRLEPETLAAYIDGLLPPEERARVDAEIAADPETYEWVVNSIGAVDDPAVATPTAPAQEPAPVPAPRREPGPAPNGSGEERKVLPFYRRRSVQGLLGTLLATAAALVMVFRTQPVWWQEAWGPSVDPRFGKLVEAVGEERYIEARLSGGFKYGPLRQVTRGPGDLSSQNLELLAAAGELQNAVEKDPSAANLHSWGVAQALLGDHDGAVKTLDAVSVLQPDAATVQSDLTAALLERARVLGRADDLPRALSTAERALVLAPQSAEAQFNLALALERLGLLDQSAEHWRLLSQSSGPWAQEALTHLLQIQRKRTPSFGAINDDASAEAVLARSAGNHGDLRVWLRTVEMERWGAAVADGDTSRARMILNRAFKIAEGLDNEDTFERDWLRHVRAADLSLRAQEARHAHMLANAARWAQNRDRRHVASLRAWRRDTDPRHPVRAWSEYFLADALRAQGARDDARGLANAAARLAGDAGYSTVAGHAVWLEALLSAVATDHQRANAMFQTALSLLIRAGDLTGQARLRSQISSMHHLNGDDIAGWRERALALTLAFRREDSSAIDIIANGGASVALERNQPAAALYFLRAQRAAAGAGLDAVGAAQADLRMAQALGQLGRRDDARQVWTTATDATSALPHGAERRALRSLAAYIESSTLLAGGQLPEAAAVASVALDAGPRNEIERTTFRLIRAYAMAAAGGVGEARQELEDVLKTVAELHRGASSLGVPDALREQLTELTGTVLTQSFASGRPLDAIALFETYNVSLALWAPVTRVDTLGALRTLPADTAVLGLISTRHRLISWLADREAITEELQTVDAAQLAGLVSLAHVSAEQHNRPAFDEAINQLSSLLIHPFSERLKGKRRLVVLTQGALTGVPFSALRITPDGPRTMMQLEVQLAPALTSRPATLLAADSRALVVIDPGSGAAGWPVLPGAAAELRKVTAASVPARIVAFEAVDREAVLAGLAEGPDVFHYSGHASMDADRPADAGLVLTGGRGNAPARLTIGDLLRGRIPAPRAVLLSACATARSTGRQREATGGLAGAFLAIGSESAVGTLWELHDGAGGDIFPMVHRYLRSGLSAPQALRVSQLEYLDEHGDQALDRVAGLVTFSTFVH